jgi:hypothetical protein
MTMCARGRPTRSCRRTAFRLILLAATTSVIGCQTRSEWQLMPIHRSGPPLVRYLMPIRVTLASGARIVLDSARVANDSLFGYRDSDRRGGADTIAPIALHQIIQIEEEALHDRQGQFGFRLAIAGIVLGIGLLATLLIGLAR